MAELVPEIRKDLQTFKQVSEALHQLSLGFMQKKKQTTKQELLTAPSLP